MFIFRVSTAKWRPAEVQFHNSQASPASDYANICHRNRTHPNRPVLRILFYTDDVVGPRVFVLRDRPLPASVSEFSFANLGGSHSHFFLAINQFDTWAASARLVLVLKTQSEEQKPKYKCKAESVAADQLTKH